MADPQGLDSFVASLSSPAVDTPPPGLDDFAEGAKQDLYGGVGQQLKAGAEGLAQGVVGPVATAAEVALGVKPEDIRGRAEANPFTHGLGETVGFVAPAILSGGASAEARAALEAGTITADAARGTSALAKAVQPIVPYTLPGVVSGIGEGAAKLAGLGGQSAGVISKIAATGVRAGAELAALQTGSEISKAITQDPNQSVQSAAINIGLSGILGGVGGAALGSVSPLWGKAKNILGVEKLATDFMAETKAIQEAGDPLQTATKELSGRLEEAESLNHALNDAKPELLAKAMPEATAENAERINGQIQNISDDISSVLKSAEKSVKTKSAVPYIAEDLTAWQNAVTDPNAGFADKFLATNKLKQTLAGYAKWGLTEEGSAKAALGKELSSRILPLLEDTKVWGGAGDIQRITNEATANVFRVTKDIRGQLLSNTMGELGVAPEKVQTLLNQTGAGRAGRKASVLANYLEYTQKQADAISAVHIENGIEPPTASKLNPTPVLDHALNTPISPGVALARWANKNGSSLLADSAGKAGAGIVGGGLGALVGHPIVGAWMGEKVLAPVFSALAKPLAENAVHSASARASVEYLGNVIKGDKILNNAVENTFKSDADVLSKDLLPTKESREKLEKALEKFQDPQHMMNVGGDLGHYMPGHSTAAAMLAASASSFLNAMKPKEPQGAPLDAEMPVDKIAQEKYDRALDVAQQPLLVLQHAKDGTLLPQDVQTLQAIYPDLHNALINKIVGELIKHKSGGKHVPYGQRTGFSMLIGSPMDSTLTSQSAQAIIHSAGAQQVAQAVQKAPRRASNTELSQINKVNQLSATPLQARQIQKRA